MFDIQHDDECYILSTDKHQALPKLVLLIDEQGCVIDTVELAEDQHGPRPNFATKKYPSMRGGILECADHLAEFDDFKPHALALRNLSIQQIKERAQDVV
ncbi:hypothetical protein [Idiomarina abyssalis]|uniref:Uncharacterized protein n=1 Tax=Idiomarina abyssalis TaxID=86102 RepID=A0A8I1GE94_9GAMM|nr:hypothetical protein [Idiomarina abyssalis]MBJ7265485.1 hypothetical protein [Idiomarina abyssalis]MBJ7316841.1 hypothetical protein [Idiomarina abyssalis]